VAVFVSVPVALAVTLTVMVNEVLEPLPRLPSWQVTVGLTTTHRVEDEEKVVPGGSVSVTIGVIAVFGPVFTTVMV